MSNHTLLVRELAVRAAGTDDLIPKDNLLQFLDAAVARLSEAKDRDILLRAIRFRLDSEASSLEISFISLYAALESILTFYRREDESKILSSQEFSELQRELRKWLRQQPSLATEPAKRGLIYEKIRELNRFPFSSVFRKFCKDHALDLSDLWPVIGPHEEWPLLEIRHRLVHGDPFANRPVEALRFANLHLLWTVERMLLCELGRPVERSNVSRESLSTRKEHQSWQEERAKFA